MPEHCHRGRNCIPILNLLVQYKSKPDLSSTRSELEFLLSQGVDPCSTDRLGETSTDTLIDARETFYNLAANTGRPHAELEDFLSRTMTAKAKHWIKRGVYESSRILRIPEPPESEAESMIGRVVNPKTHNRFENESNNIRHLRHCSKITPAIRLL